MNWRSVQRFPIALSVVIPLGSVNDAPRRNLELTASEPTCSIAQQRGPWGEYQVQDLPRGSCTTVQPCTIWTKDNCPGTNAPGPSVQWMCACDSGMWMCKERQRSKTACIGP